MTPGFDPDVMREIARDLYTPAIVAQHGTVGGERLREVLGALRVIYRRRPPESFGGGLCVFAAVDPANRPHEPSPGQPVLEVELIHCLEDCGAIQVLPNGNLLVWNELPIDLPALSAQAVVYLWQPEGEAFAVGSDLKTVRNPNGYPTAFAAPGFFVLEEALTYYYEHLARRTSCHILKVGWYDDRRLLLSNKPERTMRRSLGQHLRWALRDHAEVREEQNVTETRPVDIKVTWSTSEMLSLIEIKWLGKSVNGAGDAIATSYAAPSRSDEGAQQLEDYIDGNLDQAPTKPCTGYLIVYDARRRNVTDVPPTGFTPQDAWHYRDRDIPWPKRHLARRDIGEPRRFYLEPKIPV
jgi:hypothetical protein